MQISLSIHIHGRGDHTEEEWLTLLSEQRWRDLQVTLWLYLPLRPWARPSATAGINTTGFEYHCAQGQQEMVSSRRAFLSLCKGNWRPSLERLATSDIDLQAQTGARTIHSSGHHQPALLLSHPHLSTSPKGPRTGGEASGLKEL